MTFSGALCLRGDLLLAGMGHRKEAHLNLTG